MLDYIRSKDHIMPADRQRLVSSLFSLLQGGLQRVIEYNEGSASYPLLGPALEAYTSKFLVLSLIWSFGGSLTLRQARTHT
jgi:hypothetical protein